MASVLLGTDEGMVRLDGPPGGGRPTAVDELAGRSVGALAQDGLHWWAIVDGSEVWRARGGDVWQLCATSPGPALTCLAPVPGALLVGTAEAQLLRLHDGRLEPVGSFEEVEGRQRWYTPWGGPPDTRSMSHGGDGIVYVSVHVGGIVASHDGGRSWRPTALDIETDVHQVVAGPEPGSVLAACAEGLATSDDGGARWRLHAEGLHATYSRAVALAGATVVVSASTGPDTRRSGLYRRPISADAPFERCRTGLPEWFAENVDTGCLAAEGATVAFATREGSAFLSSDHGATWQRVASGLAPVACLALAS